MLYVDSRSHGGRFTEEDLEFLTAFANQAATALHGLELLDHHDIPQGPLLLRGSTEHTTPRAPGVRRVHKQLALRRIVEDFPRLSFVLLGDSSRRDPLRYVEVAEAYPGRVAAIYIRRVHGVLASRERLEHLVERAKRAGVELLVADDTVTAIATRWGFLHQGRFVATYRRVYGRTPGQTLRG